MTPPPAAAATPAVRTRSVPRRPARAPAPRRVSGPAKRKVTAGATAAPVRAYTHTRGASVALPAPGGLAAGLLEALTGISSNRWLDRLIRGRVWIGLLAFALIGIVAMQLWVVKLGVGIGRALEHEGLLQRENAALSIEDAKLSSGERVEQLAAARGMVVAPPGALHFETARGGLDARLAAAALARSGQVASASTSAASSEGSPSTSSGGAAEVSPSQSTGTVAEANGEAATAGATGSAESSTGESSTATAGSAGTTEGSSASSVATSESSAPTSASSTEAPRTSAGGYAATPSATTNSAGATPAASEAASGGAVSSNGGTPQPAAGG